MLRLRDRLLPLVNLAGLLRLERRAAGDENAFVVVTQVGPHVFGIIVDRVFDTEEIVVKPVAPILRHITMFSGNTILGDGSVIMILDPNGIARATGVGAETAEGEAERDGKRQVVAHRSDQRTALLLFRAGDTTPKAVPLGLIARLEDVERDRIENAGGRPLVQYRGKLMPLVPLSGHWDAGMAPERQPVLVFSDGDRAMGLMVDEILDVVEEQLGHRRRRRAARLPRLRRHRRQGDRDARYRLVAAAGGRGLVRWGWPGRRPGPPRAAGRGQRLLPQPRRPGHRCRGLRRDRGRRCRGSAAAA